MKKFGFDLEDILGRRSLGIWQHTSFIRKVDEKQERIFSPHVGGEEKAVLGGKPIENTVIGCKDPSIFMRLLIFIIPVILSKI